jgi:YegS/Rv2252/BmrU family lipid kinase
MNVYKMSDKTTLAIINPASAGGKTAKKAGEIVSKLETVIDGSLLVRETTKSLDATDFSFEAVRNGISSFIVIGGDGTIQEAVNGILNSQNWNDCELGIVNSGTGHGFVQSIGLPESLEEQIRIAASGISKTVDLGHISFKDFDGKENSRFFINESQLGIGGAVVQRVGKNHKLLGGKLAFGLTTIETVFRHPNQLLEYEINNEMIIKHNCTGLVIANGAYCGGGMNLAPGAIVDDGELDLLIMENLSLTERFKGFSKIYSGKHIHLQKFNLRRVQSLSITSDEIVLVEADGELLGTTPCDIKIIPGAIKVRYRI